MNIELNKGTPHTKQRNKSLAVGLDQIRIPNSSSIWS